MDQLVPIAGTLPDLGSATLPACRYMGRCERATEICAKTLSEGPLLRCHHPL